VNTAKGKRKRRESETFAGTSLYLLQLALSTCKCVHKDKRETLRISMHGQ
jgi:hypothetical protein